HPPNHLYRCIRLQRAQVLLRNERQGRILHPIHFTLREPLAGHPTNQKREPRAFTCHLLVSSSHTPPELVELLLPVTACWTARHDVIDLVEEQHQWPLAGAHCSH